MFRYAKVFFLYLLVSVIVAPPVHAAAQSPVQVTVQAQSADLYRNL